MNIWTELDRNADLKWISTAGHGYLVVMGAEVSNAERCSTGYDYKRYSASGDAIYLEEDCSAPLYLKTFRADLDIKLIRHTRRDELPRGLERLTAGDLGKEGL